MTVLEFITHYIKVLRFKFCEKLQKQKGHWPDKMIKPTCLFMLELEVFCFEFSKFTMLDGFSKRFQRSYVGAAILVMCFE